MSLFGKSKSPEELMRKAEKELARGEIDAFRTLADQCIESYRSSSQHFDAGIHGLHTAKALNLCSAYNPVPRYCEGARQDFSKAHSRLFEPRDSDPTRAMQAALQYHNCLMNEGLCYLEEGFALQRLDAYPRSMKALRKARNILRAWGVEKEAADAQFYWAASLISYGADKANDRSLEKAVVTLRSLKDEFISMGDSRSAAQCLSNMTQALFMLKKPQEVIDVYPEARCLCEKGGDARQLNQCRENFKHALSLRETLSG